MTIDRPVVRSPFDLSLRRLQLSLEGAYDAGAFVSVEVAHGWPGSPDYREDDGVFGCELCRHERDGAPDVWIEFCEQAAVDLLVGDWTVTICSACLEHHGQHCLLTDAIDCQRTAVRELNDAKTPCETFMKEAQRDRADYGVAAHLVPVLHTLGCDRESIRLAASEIDPSWDAELVDGYLNELDTHDGPHGDPLHIAH